MKIYKFLYIFFFSFFISKVFLIEVLNKYSSTKTSNGYIVFDSSQFKEGDKMYFEIRSSDEVCTEELYYEFYDSISSINIGSQPNKYVSKDSSSTTVINGKVTSVKLYFTIEKKELNGLSGNYLYMKFFCDGTIEFENTKSSGATKDLIIVLGILGAVFVIIIAIVIYCCVCRRRSKIKEMNRINIMNMAAQGQVYPINPYPIQGQPINQVQYGNSAYAYPSPQISYINPNNPPNVQIIPQNIPVQQSSQRKIYSQKFEKPKEYNQ